MKIAAQKAGKMMAKSAEDKRMIGAFERSREDGHAPIFFRCPGCQCTQSLFAHEEQQVCNDCKAVTTTEFLITHGRTLW